MRKLHSAVLAAALVLASGSLVAPGAARAQIAVGVTVGIAPPPLPIYDQPPIPGPGYIWTPGYWAWGGYDYYWTPGVWVVAPEPGFLWTPAYWGWNGVAFAFHTGYWGPVVGFYGGINYGFGYPGFGYGGGYWEHDRFFYNRTVNNFGNARITNVYSRGVNDPRGSRVSYNGGVGGTAARANASQLAAARQGHVGPTAMQQRHQQAAAGSPALHSAANHGAPAVAGTTHAGVLHGPGVRSAAGAAPGAGAGRIATASHGAGREGAVTRTVNHGGALARVSPSHTANAANAASRGGHARTQTANYARGGGHEASNRAARSAPSAAHYAERGGGGGGAHSAAAAPRGPAPRQEGGGGRGSGGGGHEGGGHPGSGGGHEGGGKPR